MSTPEVSVHAGDGWQVVDATTIHGRARVDDAVRAELEEAAGSGDLDAVLDVLASGGIRSMPDFAFVAVGDDTVRVVARGAGAVVVEAEDGSRTLEHSGRGPWLDEDLSTAGPLRIGEPPAAEEAPAKPKRTRRKKADAESAPAEDAVAAPAIEAPAPVAEAPAAKPKRTRRKKADADATPAEPLV